MGYRNGSTLRGGSPRVENETSIAGSNVISSHNNIIPGVTAIPNCYAVTPAARSQAPIPLSAEQRTAIDSTVNRITHGETLVAILGLAGAGKTTLIFPLCRALEATISGKVLVGTPTHRAAMILRRKGLRDVDTIHGHALTPIFTDEYQAALDWLTEDWGTKNNVPLLVSERLAALHRDPEAFFDLALAHDASTILGSIGIHGRHHLIGFKPKPHQRDTLIIDEASMVGQMMLTLCQKVFPRVILVGDPGQLPPVGDVAVLDTVPGVQLSHVHRQAEHSSILQLAYKTRQGWPFWRHGLAAYGPHCQEVSQAPAHVFLHAPLITWKNQTRLACTKIIREALGYPADRLVPGEPLVCRSTDKAARVDGFYNNSLWRVLEVSATDQREVVLIDEEHDQEHSVLLHLEDLDGDNIELDHVPFRFGYCLTAHTAQGGEWPTIYISKPDLLSYAGYSWHQNRPDDVARWAYTAVTRAKERLVLLTQHCFVKGGGV